MAMKSARIEKTFILVKPDAVQRGLVGTIIKRFEEKGCKLVALKYMWPVKAIVEEHYKDLATCSFFPTLIKHTCAGPVVPMVWEGLDAVHSIRLMLGATHTHNPAESAPGTIRGDLSLEVYRNVIHGSDSVQAAEREIGLWFNNKDLIDWNYDIQKWIQ